MYEIVIFHIGKIRNELHINYPPLFPISSQFEYRIGILNHIMPFKPTNKTQPKSLSI